LVPGLYALSVTGVHKEENDKYGDEEIDED
jgi:hypothetical protein